MTKFLKSKLLISDRAKISSAMVWVWNGLQEIVSPHTPKEVALNFHKPQKHQDN